MCIENLRERAGSCCRKHVQRSPGVKAHSQRKVADIGRLATWKNEDEEDDEEGKRRGLLASGN